MMDKEQLKAKYGNEKVLCVRNSNIEANKSLNYLDIIKYYGYTDFRYRAEIDFKEKQIIPYIVITSDDKVFVTKRIQGDPRLIGGLSIGMGGHVDDSDVILDKQRLIDSKLTIGNCMYRELTEETTIDTDKITSLELKDMFIDESNEVSSVHMCLLYTLNADGLDVEIKETDKLEGSFMTIVEIREVYDRLESWSKIAFDKLFPIIKSNTNNNAIEVISKTVKKRTTKSTNDLKDTVEV